MEDTEKYLNSILQKRLGSVPNQSYFSKNANNVTRLPRKQQKLQSMPTVFRVKAETTFKTTGVMPGLHNSKNPLLQNCKSTQVLPMKKQQSGTNQRVEYVAISKRLESKKQQFTAPTVDVSKYRKTNYIPPETVKHDPFESLHKNRQSNQFNDQFDQSQYRSQIQPQNQYQNQYQNQGQQNYRSGYSHFNNNYSNLNENVQIDGIGREAMMRPTQNQVNRVSQVSQVSQSGQRKRNIFGNSKQKFKTTTG